MFKHDLLPVTDVIKERYDSPVGRFYKVNQPAPFYNDEWYPSVTTVLSKYFTEQKTQIDIWRQRVGEEEANKVTTQAARRGTAMHKLFERYLMNDLSFEPNVMPINIMNFRKVQPILDQNVKAVLGVELPLYSHLLRSAGTTDSIVVWKNNLNTIVDFKNVKRVKKINEVVSYLTQATAYAIMVEEMYDISVPQIAIMMSVDHEDPVCFIKETSRYRLPVIKLFERHVKECQDAILSEMQLSS